jgi:hypothetical protein
MVHMKPLITPHVTHLPWVGQPCYKEWLGEEKYKLPEYSSKKILYVLSKEQDVFNFVFIMFIYPDESVKNKR